VEFPTITLPPPQEYELPPPQEYETISIPLPTADVPSYKPLVVPPSDLRAPKGVQAEASEEPEAGIKKIDIPFTNLKLPVPENEILITAGTTAVVSVAATLTATAAFKWAVTALKPILKTTWKKLSQSKKKDSLAK